MTRDGGQANNDGGLLTLRWQSLRLSESRPLLLPNMRFSVDLKPLNGFLGVREDFEGAVDIELGISDGPAEARPTSVPS